MIDVTQQANEQEMCRDEDRGLLASLEGKLTLVRDRVRSVAEGYANGLYLWGSGGTSKTFSVEQTLQKLGTPYRLTNSRLSGRGLLNLLRDCPSLTHIIDDCETLMTDKMSLGVLRSALWGQSVNGRQERKVTWQTARERQEFTFEGGVILIANVELGDQPEVRAIKTRIPVIKYEPTAGEIGALMRNIASKGHQHGNHSLPPESCLECVDAVLERSKRMERPLDLRLLICCFKDRLQWEHLAAETHWLDLLESRMQERVLNQNEQQPRGKRAERKEKELAIMASVAHLPPQERLTAWMTATGGKSPASFYRRWDEYSQTLSKQESVTEVRAG